MEKRRKIKVKAATSDKKVSKLILHEKFLVKKKFILNEKYLIEPKRSSNQYGNYSLFD